MNTLHHIWKEKLLLKPNGEPYNDIGGIRRRLQQFGHVPSVYNDKGTKIYAVSEKDIIDMNNAALNPDEDLILQSL